MVTVAGTDIAGGAVYSPVEEIFPQVSRLQPVPDIVQITVVSVVPLTDAENSWVAPGVIDIDVGLTATVTTLGA